MELHNGVRWKKSLVVMILVKSAKLFLYSCQHDFLVQGRNLTIVYRFLLHFNFSIIKSKTIFKKSSTLWCQTEFFVHFLTFFTQNQ